MTNHGFLFTFMNGNKGNSAISVQLLDVHVKWCNKLSLVLRKVKFKLECYYFFRPTHSDTFSKFYKKYLFPVALYIVFYLFTLDRSKPT